MQCQNCERPIEPSDERCPHCGAKPLTRRVFLGRAREEFTLTHEEPFEAVETLPPPEWQVPVEQAAAHRATAGEDDSAAEVRWGGFFRRAVAFSIDGAIIVLLWAIMALMSYVGYKVGLSAYGKSVAHGNLPQLFSFLALGFAGLATGYFVLFHGMDGKTIGKRLLGLKVVAEGQGEVAYWRALARWFATVAFAPLGLGFLWVLWSCEKRAWHDYVARTWVIRE